MKKCYLMFSLLFLCVFMTQQGFAQCGPSGCGGGDQGQVAEAQGDDYSAAQGGEQGNGCDTPVSCIQYCKYCHMKPCYYNTTRCDYVPKYTQKKCCRFVPQYYQKQCCRYVPQYYCKTLCRQVPEYYYTTQCQYCPKYSCEKHCKYVPEYYWKKSCANPCGQGAEQGGCGQQGGQGGWQGQGEGY